MIPTSNDQSANQTIEATNAPEITNSPRRSNVRVDPAKYREIKSDQGEIRYACTLCKKSYKYRKSLNPHWRMSHPNEIPPPLDPAIPAQEATAVKKIKVNSTPTCCLCSLTFQSMPEINEHYRTNHSDQFNTMFTKPFIEIKESAMTKEEGSDHVRFGCMVCGKTYQQISDLGRHFETSHSLFPNPYKKRKMATNPFAGMVGDQSKKKRTGDEITDPVSMPNTNFHPDNTFQGEPSPKPNETIEQMSCSQQRSDSSTANEEPANIDDKATSIICLYPGNISPTQTKSALKTVLAMAKRMSTDQLIEISKEIKELIRNLSPGKTPKTHQKNIRPISCPYCDYQAIETYSVVEHTRLCHAKFMKFHCVECGEYSDCKVHLEAHIREKHREDGVAAIIEIPERFLFDLPDFSTFARSAKLVALVDSRPVELAVVSNRINRIFYEKVHDEFKCPECPFETSISSEWFRHRLLHGRVDAEKSVELNRHISEQDESSTRKKIPVQHYFSESSENEIESSLSRGTSPASDTCSQISHSSNNSEGAPKSDTWTDTSNEVCRNRNLNNNDTRGESEEECESHRAEYEKARMKRTCHTSSQSI